MLTFIENYKAKVREVREKKEEIEAQLNKKIEKLRRLEHQIYKLKMKEEKLSYPSWVNEIIVPLAQKLAEMKGLSYEIFGPFGLMNETSIFLMKDPSISILEQEVWALTIVPGLFKGDDNLYYYNGETEDRYPKGTIGEINGMNNVKVKLPDTIEEICDLLEFHKN